MDATQVCLRAMHEVHGCFERILVNFPDVGPSYTWCCTCELWWCRHMCSPCPRRCVMLSLDFSLTMSMTRCCRRPCCCLRQCWCQSCSVSQSPTGSAPVPSSAPAGHRQQQKLRATSILRAAAAMQPRYSSILPDGVIMPQAWHTSPAHPLAPAQILHPQHLVYCPSSCHARGFSSCS